MNIKCENLGYLELEMLCDFMNLANSGDCQSLNDFISDSEEVTIGFDLRYHSAYIENEDIRFYPEDFK